MKYLFISFWLLVSASAYSTALGDAAALMKPKTFRPLTTQGLTSDMYRVGANIECIYPFANDAAWDPKTEQYMFVGAPHQIPWVWGFVVYDAKTNNWRKGNQDPYFLPSNCNGSDGGTCSHSYDNITMNGDDGFMYNLPNKRLLKYNPVTDVWSAPSVSNAGILPGPYSSMNYFPELGGLVYANAGTVALYEFKTGAWKDLGSHAMGGIHNVGEYSPVHKVMMLGGGAGSRQMYLLDTLGNFKTLKPSPWDIEVSQCLHTCDPVSGDFLVLRTDSLYAYDMAADEWRGVVKNPIANFTAHWAVVAPISTYGVVAFLTNYSWPFLLYKHADQSAVEKGAAASSVQGPFSVYPNPALRGSVVKISAKNGLHVARFSVCDISGKVIVTGAEGEVDWNTRGLASGLYVVKMEGPRKVFTKKILIHN